MHRFFVSLLFVTLLTLGVSSRAAASDDFDEGPIGRCIEAPMSLALRIAEYEAARLLPPEDLTSPATPIVATPAPRPRGAATGAAPAPRPFSAAPRACTDPRDPRCQMNALPPAPERASFTSDASFAVLAPVLRCTVPASRRDRSGRVWGPVTGFDAPRVAHLRAHERPPRASSGAALA